MCAAKAKLLNNLRDAVESKYEEAVNSTRTLAPQGNWENRGSRQGFDDKRLNIGVSRQLRPVLKSTRRAASIAGV